jgi:hypothetical protein
MIRVLIGIIFYVKNVYFPQKKTMMRMMVRRVLKDHLHYLLLPL